MKCKHKWDNLYGDLWWCENCGTLRGVAYLYHDYKTRTDKVRSYEYRQPQYIKERRFTAHNTAIAKCRQVESGLQALALRHCLNRCAKCQFSFDYGGGYER